MADQRARLLLGIAAVLAGLRFVVVPWIGSQDEARDQLQVLTQRLDRSEGVLQNRDAILSARDQLAAANEAARAHFPVAASVDAFRLDAQQGMAALAAANGLKLSLFDWLLDGAAGEAGLAFGRVRMQADGPPRDLARLHAALEAQLPHVAIREVQLSSARPVGGVGEGNPALTLVADVYFRLQEAKP
jgi:hypothetical protein